MINTTAQPNCDLTLLRRRSYAGLVGAPGCIITSVDGQQANVGKTVELPSGATVKIKADGSWVYNVASVSIETSTHEKAVDAVRYEIIEDTELRSGVLSVCINCQGKPQILTEDSSISTGADQHSLQPIHIMVNSSTRTPVRIDLRDLFDADNESPATVLLKDSEVGKSRIDENGILTFTPNSSFTGKTTIKCLVEQLDGTSRVVEILLAITQPVQFSDGLNM